MENFGNIKGQRRIKLKQGHAGAETKVFGPAWGQVAVKHGLMEVKKPGASRKVVNRKEPAVNQPENRHQNRDQANKNR